MIKEKNNFWSQLIAFSILVYLFFLSHRGGDAKDIVALFIMLFTLIYSYKEGIKKYLFYKKEILSACIYLFLTTLSFIFSENKSSDRLYIFTHMTLYSVGFFLVLLNYKLENKYIKYIFPLLIMLSIPSIYRGLMDVFIHYKELYDYRIGGKTYTSRYQLETGIYFLLGLFSFFYYKKKTLKFILLIYTVLNFSLMLLTQSRNALIGILITVFCLGLIFNIKKTLITSLIIFLLLSLSYNHIKKIRSINRIENSITSVEKIKKDVRFDIYKYGINQIKNNLIKGKGFYFYKEGTLGKEIGENHEPYMHFHNIILETSITQGLITALSYLVFLILIFLRSLKNYFKEKDTNKKIIKLFGIAIFIFSISHGIFETIFYFEKLYQLIFTILMFTFIIDNEERENI
jgi:O-antigen polymerase superfamily